MFMLPPWQPTLRPFLHSTAVDLCVRLMLCAAKLDTTNIRVWQIGRRCFVMFEAAVHSTSLTQTGVSQCTSTTPLLVEGDSTETKRLLTTHA